MNTLIVFDKGHGGIDPGAEGNGLIEAELNNTIVDLCVEKLSKKYQVDIEIAPRGFLSERTNFVNNLGRKVDYFVSIHVNAGGS